MLKENKYILLLSLVGFCYSCASYEPIAFITLENVRVRGISDGNLLVEADAVFNNPNKVKAQVKQSQIYVVYKSDTLAHIQNDSKQPILPEANFTIPLQAEVSIAKLQQGILKNIKALFTKRSVELTFVGNVKASTIGFTQNISVNYTQTIEF